MSLTINTIPQPQSVITGKGSLDLRTINKIIIKTVSKQELAIAQFFQKLLKPINHIGIERFSNHHKNHFLVSLNKDSNLPD